MKKRSEIKAQAMRGFTSKYWPVVGINVLLILLMIVMSVIPGVNWLLTLLVGTIIQVGFNLFCLNVYRGDEVKVEKLFSPFNRYGRVLGGSLWRVLWLFLWALIFIIPVIVLVIIGFVNAFMSGLDLSNMANSFGNMGPFANNMMGFGNFNYMMNWSDPAFANSIASFFNPLWLLMYLLLIPVIIKTYSYFATRYILADSPNVPAMDALTLSKKMMVGFKWKLFVTQLTFIGWFILCGLTFGILYIFFVGPYYNATIAGFYDEVKQQAKLKGIPGTELL